jgi:predicted Co/Zn/Cd cation transporter (cation efflux family)
MRFEIKLFLRDILGLLVGSFVAALVFLFLPMLWASSRDVNFSLSAILPGTILICFFSFPCGLAAHALLHALKWRWLAAYCLAAALEAAVYNSLSAGHFTVSSFQDTAMYAISASVCAAIAWMVRRPNRDVKTLEKLEL